MPPPHDIETPEQLKDFVWARLPVRKRLRVGRYAVNDLTDVILYEFPDDLLISCVEGGDGQEKLAEQLLQTCKRHFCAAHGEDQHNVGFIWTALLISIASTLITEIIKWWWARRQNREMVVEWRKPKGN